jgi:hypothetical protein
MTDLRDADSSRIAFRVSQGDDLPEICYNCGQETNRYSVVVRSSCRDEVLPPGFAQWLISLFVSLPMALFFALRQIQNTNTVRVRIPQCRTCASHGIPQPQYVDFGNARMTFVVHQNFHQAVTACEARHGTPE